MYEIIHDEISSYDKNNIEYSSNAWKVRRQHRIYVFYFFRKTVFDISPGVIY